MLCNTADVLLHCRSYKASRRTVRATDNSRVKNDNILFDLLAYCWQNSLLSWNKKTNTANIWGMYGTKTKFLGVEIWFLPAGNAFSAVRRLITLLNETKRQNSLFWKISYFMWIYAFMSYSYSSLTTFTVKNIYF